jgi:protein gp37
MADVFDNQVDPAWRVDLFNLIRETPALDWLLLTKRPQNIAKMLPADWANGWPHVWLGCTTEDQTEFDRRWHHLYSNPAVVRFISYEPAMGPLRLPPNGPRPDWVICAVKAARKPER